LGAYFAFEPRNDSIAYNKAIKYLAAGIKECDQKANPQLKLIGQRLIGKLYLKNRDFANADKQLSAARDGFLKLGDQPGVALTYSWWGLYAPVTATSTTPRIEHTEMALKIFKSLGDKEGQINSLVNDSYLHMLRYDLATASKLAKEAHNLTKMAGFPYAHYVTGALMSITLFQGKFGEPLTYGIESLESSEITKDNIGLPYFYGVVGQLYQKEEGRENIAINWEKKSINSFLSQHEPCYMGLDDVVGTLLARGRKAEALAYIKKVTFQVPPVTILDSLFYNLTIGHYNTYTKQWKPAHQFFNKAADIEQKLEKRGLNVRKPAVLINMAILYYKEGNYKLAKIYYNQYFSQPSVIKGGFFANNTEALQALVKIDSLEGDYTSELKDYRRLNNVITQNFTVSKTRLAEELQVKYATTDRINQISLLNQKAKLEQSNLEQANLTKNITIIGIILLIIIVGLLYRQVKIRKRSNEIISGKNELMQKLLDEKEWLLKEVHHRVKNNLHTIICLLESQAIYLESDALEAVENSRHRIYSMSLIHQKLYQSDDIKVVDINIYLTEFVEYLRESFGMPEHIKVILLAEHIKLSAIQAIPIGLIINETITNAFKYAFPNQRRGEIKVELKRVGEEIYLSVTDNGVGFKQQADQEVNSLGLELIRGLTLDLRGNMNINTENGTSIQIQFKITRIGNLVDGKEILSVNS
jgi:two-component sensor histidine kinase